VVWSARGACRSREAARHVACGRRGTRWWWCGALAKRAEAAKRRGTLPVVVGGLGGGGVERSRSVPKPRSGEARCLRSSGDSVVVVWSARGACRSREAARDVACGRRGTRWWWCGAVAKRAEAAKRRGTLPAVVGGLGGGGVERSRSVPKPRSAGGASDVGRGRRGILWRWWGASSFCAGLMLGNL